MASPEEPDQRWVQAQRILTAVRQAGGYHPERNMQSHPTIGQDARADFTDPSPWQRWAPPFQQTRTERLLQNTSSHIAKNRKKE